MSTTASGFFGSGVVMKSVLLSGTGTWTVPDAIYGNKILVTMAGGGGSGRAGAITDGMLGGAGGECLQRTWYSYAAGTGYSVGAGGAGVAATANGNAGGNTTFGTLQVAGGSGGNTTITAILGTPGFIRDGTVQNTPAKNPGGFFGGDGGICHASNGLFGGGGGLLLFDLLHRTNSVDGQGYGAGGGGVTSGSSNAGKVGVIMLEWWEYA